MKKLKIYLTAVVGVFSFASMAQTDKTPGQLTLRFPSDDNNIEWKRFSPLGKAEMSDWYFPATFGVGALNGAVTFLLNDSAKFYSNTGDSTYNASDVALAQILDPKDDGILQTNNPALQLSKFANYKVDSIAFRYLYRRKIDSVLNPNTSLYEKVVDTLFVYYFKGAQISTNQGFVGRDTKFGYLGWSFATQSPANYSGVDTILLNDTSWNTPMGATGWVSQYHTMATPASANMTINSNGSLTNSLVAFALRFKHGLPFDSSYVLEDRRTNPDPNNKYVNYFGYHVGEATNNVENDQFYNSSLTVSPVFAFRSINGWTGWFPNYAGTYTYPSTGLYLTTSNVGINEKKNNEFGMTNVYPNPAKTNGKAVLGVNLKKDAVAHIHILDLYGKEIKTISNAYNAGEQAIEVNLDGMKAGVYFFNVTVNGVTETKKLTVTE